MDIVSTSPTEMSITNYVTSRDRGQLAKILRDIPERLRYAEAASDGITFVGNYWQMDRDKVQIAPPQGMQFGPYDIADILARCGRGFGSFDENYARVAGQLDKGVVLEAADESGTHPPLAETFAQIRNTDAYPSS